MTNINSMQNINSINFRSSSIKSQNLSTPIDNQPRNFDSNFQIDKKGAEILAAYNYNLVNKNNDFNIPTLPLISVPNNIEEVIGEKVYAPDGKLDYVVQDKGKNKIIYKNDDYKTIQIVDKNTNKVIMEQGCFVANTKEVRVTENINGKVGYFTDYDEKNGKMKPISKGKHIYYEDDTKREFIYSLITNKLKVIERSNVSKDPLSCDKVINYDKQGNLFSVEIFNKS